MNKVFDALKERIEEIKNQEGFSLIELVVAVGILAILAVLGVVGYRGITEHSRETAVASAADTVFKSAMTRNADGNSKTDPLTADEEWMKSAAANNKIKVDVQKSGNDIIVSAWYDDNGTERYRVERSSGSGDDSEIETPEVENPESPEDETPVLPVPPAGGVLIAGTAHPLIKEAVEATYKNDMSEVNVAVLTLGMREENNSLNDEDYATIERLVEQMGKDSAHLQDVNERLMANPEALEEFNERFEKVQKDERISDVVQLIFMEGRNYDPETRTFANLEEVEALVTEYDTLMQAYYNAILA